MNVLIASVDDPDRTYGGGKHVHIRQLAASLQILGHRVATAFPPARSPAVEWIRSRVLWRLGGDGLLTRRNVARLVRDFEGRGGAGFDVVNAHDVVAGARVRGPVVLTLHGYFARELLNYGCFAASAREAIFRDAMAVERAAMARARAVIAVDRRIADYAQAEFGYPADRIHVIHNAVDTEGFVPAEGDERASLRAGLGIPAGAFLVLVPRRLVRKNGVVFAAEALRRLAGDDVVLAVAGTGSEEPAVLAAAGGDPRLRMLGGVPHAQVRAWFRACDVVLVPSVPSDDVEEATSLSMLEGMACGKAVVCSAIGGMKEVVADGRTGLLTPPGDPDAIAAALRAVRSDGGRKAALGQAARAHVVEHHSCLGHARRFADVFAVAAGLPVPAPVE